MNPRDLFLRLRALVVPRRVERELDDELTFHLEREMRKHIAAGLSPVDARTRARARFGPLPLAADQCRDARRTGVVDDLTRDVLYAFRTFRRAPFAALTIVATVALGLGLVMAVFAVYNMFLLRGDAVRSPRELFAVVQGSGPGLGQGPARADRNGPFTWADYDAMRRETSVFVDVFAMSPYFGTLEGRPAMSAFVTGNFFQVLGVQAALGRVLSPEDDQRVAGGSVIVLSHAGWNKRFAGDPSVVGRSVRVDGVASEIVGVMPDGFRGLSITPPDYWAPAALAGQFRDASDSGSDKISIEIIGRLKPGMSPEAAAARLTAWASGRTDRPPSRATRDSSNVAEASGAGGTIRLMSRQGTLSDGYGRLEGPLYGLFIFSPIFFAFGLILMIGCANVANLLLARGVSRQREIGIRLSLGASRRRIVRQLLTESLLLSVAAAACGLVVARLLLDGVLYAVTTTLPPEMVQFVSIFNLAAPADWRVLVFAGAGAIVSTCSFGLAPALQATRLDLVRTMRGEVTRDARPRRARHGLIAIQVGASALLLICAAIFLRGAFAAATRGPGIRTSDTVRVSIETESRRAAVIQEVTAHPLVAVVAASSPIRRGVLETIEPVGRSPREGGPPVSVPVSQTAVSSDYFDVIGFAIVRGRSFTQAERTADAGVVVLSESIARQLWPNGGGVGQMVRLFPEARSAEASTSSRTLTVVGVVRDSGSVSTLSSEAAFRGAYLPTGPESPGAWLYLRVRGNPGEARLALLERLKGLDAAFGVMTLQTMAGMQTYVLRMGFWITIALGGLALVLTVSGLFSVLSFVVEQQAKEIGVRMALGATTRNVAELVLRQSLRPVGVGLSVGCALAAAVAIVLMSTSASEIGGFVDVFDPMAYGASALVIVISCVLAVSVPALRAARIDPIATLRRD